MRRRSVESRVICAWNTLGVMRGITRGILAPKSSGKILHIESFFVGHNVSSPWVFFLLFIRRCFCSSGSKEPWNIFASEEDWRGTFSCRADSVSEKICGTLQSRYVVHYLSINVARPRATVTSWVLSKMASGFVSQWTLKTQTIFCNNSTRKLKCFIKRNSLCRAAMLHSVKRLRMCERCNYLVACSWCAFRQWEPSCHTRATNSHTIQ